MVMEYRVVHTLPDNLPTWTAQSYHVDGLRALFHSPPVQRVPHDHQWLEYRLTHPTAVTHQTGLVQ